jgi:hypothetical protein
MSVRLICAERPRCSAANVAIGVALACVAGFAAIPEVAHGFSIGACFRAEEQERADRHPRYLTTPPPHALSSILAVLRRNATRSDNIPAATLREVNPSEYRALWPHATRLLGIGPDRTRYFLVVGFRSPPGLPRACIRHPGEHPRVTGPDGVVATLVWRARIPGGESTGALPYASAWISDGAAISASPTEASTWPFFGIVPDGVARIAVTVGIHPPTQLRVANNFADGQVPEPHPGESILQQWYATDGSLIKTINSGSVTILTTG